MIGARTRVFALLGDPVTHSVSPGMHNAAFRALGLDAVYVALRCDAAAVGPLIDGLAAAGGGGNVTVPHKRAAAAHLAAGAAGAVTVNTFWGDDGRARGADTDAVGIEAGWRRLGAPRGDWLIVGTGGSARAAARVATAVGAGIAVRSRSAERAREFEAWVRCDGGRVGDEGEAALWVNCTPLGLSDGDPLPVEPSCLRRDAAALDLAYAPGGTAWSRAVRATGRRAEDGREVLLAQGAESFRRWFPEVEPPIEVMRAAVESALGPARA